MQNRTFLCLGFIFHSFCPRSSVFRSGGCLSLDWQPPELSYFEWLYLAMKYLPWVLFTNRWSHFNVLNMSKFCWRYSSYNSMVPLTGLGLEILLLKVPCTESYTVVPHYASLFLSEYQVRAEAGFPAVPAFGWDHWKGSCPRAVVLCASLSHCAVHPVVAGG